MSRKRNSHPFALVYWTESNEISVLDSRCVVDPEMLRDFNKIGMIEFGEPSITAPPEGWPMFLGKVLAVSDDESKLRKLEDDFIRNGRLKYESQLNRSSPNKNKRRRTKAQDLSNIEIVERRTRRNTAMDKQDLIKRIGILEEQLESEKEKNRQLMRFNVQLQEDLPKLIENAMKTINSTYSFKRVEESSGRLRRDNGQVMKSSNNGQPVKDVGDNNTQAIPPQVSSTASVSSKKTEVDLK